jgi:hypothetical protein
MIDGVSKSSLRDFLRRTFKQSGVGYYPKMPFVHFDVREQSAFWVDLSGSGEDAQYVANADEYLKKELKESAAREKRMIAQERSEPETDPQWVERSAGAARTSTRSDDGPVYALAEPVKEESQGPSAEKSGRKRPLDSVPVVVMGPAPLGAIPPEFIPSGKGPPRGLTVKKRASNRTPRGNKQKTFRSGGRSFSFAARPTKKCRHSLRHTTAHPTTSATRKHVLRPLTGSASVVRGAP